MMVDEHHACGQVMNISHFHYNNNIAIPRRSPQLLSTHDAEVDIPILSKTEKNLFPFCTGHMSLWRLVMSPRERCLNAASLLTIMFSPLPYVSK